MPAAYAHYRFGAACIETMPKALKDACLTHRELFDFGVHGPDIFFYYHPLSRNEVNGFGSMMHHRSGREFFEKCTEVYHTTPRKKAMMAYMLGFLAHFTLDSCCHGYINAMTESSPYSHNKIESEYEAFLMRLDDLDPLEVDRSASLVPSWDNASVIAGFFDFTPEEVLTSLKGQRTTLHLFYSPMEYKKKTVRTLIRSLSIGGSFDDLFLDRDELADCAPMNLQILKDQEQALAIYPKLLRNFIAHLLGKEELDAYFAHDFEGGIVE